MSKYFLSPNGQPYRIREGVPEAFDEKARWFPSAFNPLDGKRDNYFRRVSALCAWLVVYWRLWRAR